MKKSHRYAEIKVSLEKILDYEFSDETWIIEALSHKSVSSEMNSERLEFLGDRVLGLFVAEMLFDIYPHDTEGDLAKRLSHLVDRKTLAEVAKSISLADYIFIGKDDDSMRRRPKLLADSLEAVIGALYCDGGGAIARKFIKCHWQALAESMEAPPIDSKSALQEWAMKELETLPEYTLLNQSGTAHEPYFTIEVSLPELGSAIGKGKSRKQAETIAASKLYQKALT